MESERADAFIGRVPEPNSCHVRGRNQLLQLASGEVGMSSNVLRSRSAIEQINCNLKMLQSIDEYFLILRCGVHDGPPVIIALIPIQMKRRVQSCPKIVQWHCRSVQNLVKPKARRPSFIGSQRVPRDVVVPKSKSER